MKAVAYNGPRDVTVSEVDDARIEIGTDAIVRITSTNICGSDLHMYEGRTDFEQGRTFGHENLGQVVEVGDACQKVQVGDWVCLPFNAVAEREGVSRAEARLHVRAVFETLAEAIGDDELEDVTAQLPAEFRALFPRRR